VNFTVPAFLVIWTLYKVEDISAILAFDVGAITGRCVTSASILAGLNWAENLEIFVETSACWIS